MRKSFLILMMIISLPGFAMKYDTGSTLPLQGGYGAVLSVDVNPLKAQSNEYMAGMPFNIADNSVQPSASGRAIAEWSFLANTDFNVKINAEPLHPVSQTNINLNYELIFQYEMGYVSFGEEVEEDGQIYIYSKDHTATVEEQIPHSFMKGTAYDPDYFIGSVDGMVFFRFVDGTVIDDSLPAGEYTATVDILIESGE